MKHTRTRSKLFALGAAIVLATTGLVANADIISHTIGTDDATISVTAGGPAGGTTYRVTTENGDGKNGCNLTGQTALVVDVVSSDPSIATASPSQVTFGTCDDLKTVTVLGIDAGTATISLRQVSNTTAGTFNLAPATFTVVVNAGTQENRPPAIKYEGQDPETPNSAGWYNEPVTFTWTCTDPDGADDIDGSKSRTSVTLGEGRGGTATGICTDLAGLTATHSVTGVNVDLTLPEVALIGGPADGSNHYFGSVPAAPTCDAFDALSGLTSPDCVVSGYSAAVGKHTVTATATDLAGNVRTDSRSYEVLAWTISGFKSPVDMGGAWNSVKGGATVPLKFEVFAGDTELTDTSIIASFQVAGVTCSADSLKADDIEFTTTGKTVLRYDATEGQFIQNWQTPKSPGACYKVTMTTVDGSHVSALFKLK